jgi:hypothetical protein
VGPLSFAWSNAALTEDLSNVVANTYFVSITDNGAPSLCVLDTFFVVNNSNGPTVTSVQVIDEICLGENDGSVTATASGGTGLLTYLWQPGNLSGASQSGLAPGTYQLTVTDASLCTATAVAEVEAGPNCCDLSITNVQLVNETCSDENGSIAVTVFSSNNPLVYSWSSGESAAKYCKYQCRFLYFDRNRYFIGKL